MRTSQIACESSEVCARRHSSPTDPSGNTGDGSVTAAAGVASHPRLAGAVVDRLTFRAHIMEIGSESYRLRAARTKRKASAPAA